jgi:hypothetical protein
MKSEIWLDIASKHQEVLKKYRAGKFDEVLLQRFSFLLSHDL